MREISLRRKSDMDCESRRQRGTCAIYVLDRIILALAIDATLPVSPALRRTIDNLIDDLDRVCGHDCVDRSDRLQVFLDRFAAQEAVILATEPAFHPSRSDH
jgi:hypothetical protein